MAETRFCDLGGFRRKLMWRPKKFTSDKLEFSPITPSFKVPTVDTACVVCWSDSKRGSRWCMRNNDIIEFWPEVESRTQGSRPRLRTQKNFEAKDRPSRGQGPRSQTQVFSERKQVIQKFFSGDLKKKVLKILAGEKGLQKIFFQAISTWGKQKKVFANFPRGFWRFSTKFQQFKK